MIDHKQSVEEHALAVAERERKDQEAHARRIGRAILRDIAALIEADGLRAANEFFSPTVVRTRAEVRGVREKFLWLTEEIVEEGRNQAGGFTCTHCYNAGALDECTRVKNGRLCPRCGYFVQILQGRNHD